MDFLDPVKKKRHQIRLMVGYCLIAIAVLMLSFILLLISYGYDIDRRTGQIIQNGLVYTATHPVSAQVYANNELKGRTSLKLTIPAGHYEFAFKAAGYHDWSTTINLEGGGVEQLIYPLMIPQTLTAKDIKLYTKVPSMATSSIDGHWLLVLNNGSITNFDMYDLTKPTSPPVAANLPAKLLKTVSGSQSIKAVEWSSDNKHVLLEHDYKDGKEFIVMDRTAPAKSYNVNTSFNIAPSQVVLHDKKFDRLYAYIAKTQSLISINARTKQVSTILKNVLDFKAYKGDTVLYTSDNSKKAGQYAVNIWDGNKTYLLHNYPAKTDYLLDMGQFNGQTYVAVAPVAVGRVYIFQDPMSQVRDGKVPNPFIALKINNPQVVAFSLTSRFIGAQSGSSFAVYDFDDSIWHYFKLDQKVPITSKAAWIDGYRFGLDIDNKFNILDFNGDNQYALATNLPGFKGYFDNKFSAIYTVSTSAQTAKKSALTRTSLVVAK